MKAKYVWMILWAGWLGMATAQEGPGGAGNATTNRYWYDVNQIDQLDNTSVSSWVNRGGNGTAAIQNALNARPFYREGGGLAINGMPVLEMDGFDDRMVIPNDNDLNTGTSQTVRTFFVVVRTGADISTRQVIYEEGGSIRGLNIYINSGSLFWGAWNTPNDGAGSPWPFQFISTPISASTTYIIGFAMAGNDAITGTITGYLDGVEVGTMSGIGRLYAHSGAIGIGAKEGATVFETGSSNGNGERFSGEVAEFIHYNTVVTQAERILVENYLSSKYDIAIGGNDRHSMDSNGNGNYDFDVAGIGQAADASSSTDGRGSSIVRVSGANNLGNNEFLLWGHNGGALTETSNSIPATVDFRLNRIWRVSETGEVGNHTVRIDITGLTISGGEASDFVLIRKNSDTNFQTGADLIAATSFAGNIIQFDNVDFENGDFFTLGTNIGLFGNTGPGGVGTDQQYRFWFDVSDRENTQPDGGRLSTWFNKGGNPEVTTQTGNLRPVYRSDPSETMNGQPVLQFDGVDERFRIPNNTDLNTSTTPQAAKTFIVTFRTGSNVSTRQVIYEEGGGTRGLNIYIFNGQLYVAGWNQASDGAGAPWNFDFVNTAVSTNTDYIVTFIFNGNSGLSGTMEGFLNGQSFGTVSGIGLLYAHAAQIGIGAKENDTYYETGSSGGNAERYSGEMAEFIHFNEALTDSRRIIIENYLAAKYGISLAANDVYTMDNTGNGDYDHEMAGIGMAADGSLHTDAKGIGMVRIFQPSDLASNGEYMLWGHNDGPLCGGNDLPGGVASRMGRQWRITEAGQLGTHSLSFDLTGVSFGNGNNVRLLIDTDGNFSNATVVTPSNVSGNIIEFENINLANGNYFTVGSTSGFDIDAEVTTWSGASSTSWFASENWTNGVPDATTDAIIPAGPSNMPLVDGPDGEVHSLTVQGGATLTVNDLVELRVEGDWTNSGMFVSNEQGRILMTGGCSSATIQNNSAQTVADLTIDKAAGIQLNGRSISLTGTLTLTSGQFDTGDSLSLVSDASSTARIAEITGGSITGEISMQRHIDAGQTNWRFFSYAVSGATLEELDDDFITSGFPGTDYPGFVAPGNLFPSLQFYDETVGVTFNDGFVVPNSTSDVVGVGQGIWAWSGDTITGTQPFQVDVRGPANTGNINLPVTYTNTGSPADDGWSLVGNPYPSTIDWLASGWTKTNIPNAIYVWNPDNAQYATFVGGVGTNGGSRYIASMQAFYVQASGNNPVLTVRENCKVTNDVGFLRPQQPDLLRLEFGIAGRTDETVVRFAEEATDQFDQALDAHVFSALQAPAPRMHSLWHGEAYTVNTLSDLAEYRAIPLVVSAPESGTATIGTTDLSGIDGGCVLLEDRLTGKVTDLLQGTYTFEYNAASAGEGARFVLHISRFSNDCSEFLAREEGPDDPLSLEAGSVAASGPEFRLYPNPTNGVVWMEVNQSGAGNLTFQVLNMAGQLLETLSLRNGGATSVDLSHLPAGIYVGQVTADNGIVHTERIVISGR